MPFRCVKYSKIKSTNVSGVRPNVFPVFSHRKPEMSKNDQNAECLRVFEARMTLSIALNRPEFAMRSQYLANLTKQSMVDESKSFVAMIV